MALTFGLTLLAMVAGQTRAADDLRARQFYWCGTSPCVMGITPGNTDWHEAQTTLARQQHSYVQPKSIVFPLQPEGEASFFISVDGVSVGRTYLSFRQPVSVGWLMARYGSPCGLTFYLYSDTITLRYPFLLANINLPDGHLHPHMPVHNIQFSDPHFMMKAQPDVCVDNITDGARNRRWLGFADRWYYLLQAPLKNGQES